MENNEYEEVLNESAPRQFFEKGRGQDLMTPQRVKISQPKRAMIFVRKKV